MDSFENRLDTFSKWPLDLPKPEDLAAIGFYHDPTDRQLDRVSCWLCSAAVYGWKPDDSVLERHREAYCECAYVKMFGRFSQPNTVESRGARRMTFKRWPHKAPFKAIPSKV